MAEFLNTLMNTDPAHIFLAVGAIFVICRCDWLSDEEDDDSNSDYENASWNPSSVNYNG